MEGADAIIWINRGISLKIEFHEKVDGGKGGREFESENWWNGLAVDCVKKRQVWEGDAKERQITNRELQGKWEKERYPVVFSSVHTNTVFNQIFLSLFSLVHKIN
jgi:predicted Zn-dependent protease